MSLQASFAQPMPVNAAQRRPIRTWGDNIVHGALSFPLLCAGRIEGELARFALLLKVLPLKALSDPGRATKRCTVLESLARA